MNRSSSTPPTFIAIPWTPVGSPKRNSERMIVQSGRQPMPRGNGTTQPPVHRASRSRTAADERADASTVPIAAPAVPNAGIGPSPRIRITLKTMFSTVIATPSTQRRLRVARGAQRAAQHEEEQHADAERRT